ncbi:MAG: PHB depolymerase family esterase [Candidatus Kryptoniota bacterium]
MKTYQVAVLTFNLFFCAEVSRAQYDTLVVGNASRLFHLHVPPSYDGMSRMPLVIAIHGASASAIDFESMTGFSSKADEEGFIVVYPQGTGNPISWNAGSCCYSAVTDNVNDVGFISAMIDSLLNRYKIDSTRIYAAGFSNGSMMAYRLAAELSNKIAAGSGQMVLKSINPSRGVAIIHFHGLEDHTVPYDGSTLYSIPPVDTALSIWRRINGCNVTPDLLCDSDGVLATMWAAGGTGADIILYLSSSGGHSWPIWGISETDIAWEFFKSHPMNLVTSINVGNRRNSVKGFLLEQNYPNPFNPKTVISYQLPVICHVILKVYDVLGREVATVVDGKEDAGTHAVTFAGSRLSSGVYFYNLTAGGFTAVKEFALVK